MYRIYNVLVIHVYLNRIFPSGGGLYLMKRNPIFQKENRFKDINLGIVCPMANEQDTAEPFILDVFSTCRHFNFNSVKFYAILDNACTDRTIDIVREMSKREDALQFVYAPENKCVVDAYIRGYHEALSIGSNWILEIDAGYSHQPADIPQFFQTMLQGYDCVFGSRFCPGGKIMRSSKSRYLISRGGSILANILLGTKLCDMTSGFELFTQQALREILDSGISSNGPFFQTEIRFYAHRFKIAEVPIHYERAGHKIGSAAILDSFYHLYRLFRLRRSVGF